MTWFIFFLNFATTQLARSTIIANISNTQLLAVLNPHVTESCFYPVDLVSSAGQRSARRKVLFAVLSHSSFLNRATINVIYRPVNVSQLTILPHSA